MKINLKPKAYLYPMPVIIVGTYDEDGTPNAMNAAWGTVCDENKIAVVLSATHKTVKNLLKSKAFTIAMADKNNLVSADYVGIVSSNEVKDKIQKSGWTTTKAQHVNAPIINELPLTMELKLISYDFETEICVGEVVNVVADESIITDKKIDLNKSMPILYDCDGHGYYTIGEKVGNAFCDGKKLK